MKKVISMLVVAALAVFGNVEAKPEVRPMEHPVMHPIAHPTNPELEKPKFEHKRHHVRPHRHGKRHMRKPIIIRKGKHVCPRCGEKHAPGKQPRMMKK